MNTLDKFLKYISFDTTSDSKKEDTPSTESQRVFAKFLVEELKSLNLDEVYYDEKYCYIYGLLKGDDTLPKIGFVSHLDTSEDASGKDIKPHIIKNYDGKDITLKENVILSPNIYPDLKNHIGKTLITTDGTTLLGSDDKAGITEIMNMLEYFRSKDEKHGDIYICFTPDEEIGLGTMHFDLEHFKPSFAYTVDGSAVGKLSYENFNAATATINIKGNPSHCGTAKGIMINAARIATIFNSLVPEEMPENTEGYEGFFHLENISGDVANAQIKYLIRDFDKENFENRKEILKNITNDLNKKFNNCIDLNIKDSYYNMFEVVNKEKSFIEKTLNAIKNVGIKPIIEPTRGGTDGTDISFMGIPCPNLGTGGHNFHSIYEYVCLEDIEKTAEILISIIKEFTKE